MSWNPLTWFSKGGAFGRGSKADRLVRALPNPKTILRNADAWAAVLKEWGDAGAKWEPQESRVIDMIRSLADANNLLGPLIGASGEQKYSALLSQLRSAIAGVYMADEVFDRFWESTGSRVLESYLSRGMR